jgi:hypothetical protein
VFPDYLPLTGYEARREEAYMLPMPRAPIRIPGRPRDPTEAPDPWWSPAWTVVQRRRVRAEWAAGTVDLWRLLVELSTS